MGAVLLGWGLGWGLGPGRRGCAAPPALCLLSPAPFAGCESARPGNALCGEHLHACIPTTKHRKGSETSAQDRQDARAALLSHTLVKLIGKGVVEAACVVERMVRRQTVRVHTLVGGQGRL